MKPRKLNHEEYYEVESIIGKKKEGKTLLYRVKWEGYPENESTWEPSHKLFNCLDLINEFESTNKHSTPAVVRRKPKPKVSFINNQPRKKIISSES